VDFITDFSKGLHIIFSVVISQWCLPVGVHWTANRSMNNGMMTQIFLEFCHDSDIDMLDCTAPDDQVSGLNLGDSCSNSDDS
jgi:hypothetical protein